MSGHSKWHNIQAKKGKTDAARGAMFTILGMELAVAAKGNPNPDTNSKLADAIAKAKAANMPNDTIKRSIAKAAGELGDKDYKELTYEGYGVGGAAVIINTLTDNVNRTAGDVSAAMKKYGGNMGVMGCVSYLFDKKGYIAVERTATLDDDTMMEYCLEAGADDYTAQDDAYEVYCAPENFSAVRGYLEGKGLNFFEAAVKMIPQSYISLDEEKLETFRKMLDRLNELDDVQDVYHNVEMPEEDDED